MAIYYTVRHEKSDEKELAQSPKKMEPNGATQGYLMWVWMGGTFPRSIISRPVTPIRTKFDSLMVFTFLPYPKKIDLNLLFVPYSLKLEQISLFYDQLCCL